MREALAAGGRRVAVGVTTGRAFCGSVGSRWRREYTMLGGVVNLAARLMQEAGEGVLCDAATAEAARAALAFEALPPVGSRAGPTRCRSTGRGARGRAARPGPEPVARPRWSGGRTSGPGWPGALGRLTAGGDGRTQVLVLEGEAGAGKSRLVAELVDQAVAAGCRCWTGPATRSSATPWHPGGSCSAGCPLRRRRPGGTPAPGARAARPGPRGPRPGPAAQPGAGPGAARDRRQRRAERAGPRRPHQGPAGPAAGGGRGDPDGAGDRGRPLAGLGLDRAGAGPQPGTPAAAAGGGHPAPGDTGTLTDDLGWAAYRRLLGARTWSCWCWTGSPPTRSGTWSASAWARPRSPRPWPGWSRARPRATRCSPRS